ncbi:MAG: hypothetical protein KDA84_13345 [Planctomycetaceae bacterium]|nr:hypothetical protein [Planctomycetaceae bacterium]
MFDNDALFVWAAQIINFLILVALLRKFLYQPVLNAIASRQQEVTSRVAAAEQSHANAEQLAASCRAKEQELDAARDTLLAEARREIEEWKQEALAEARADVDQSQSQWWEAMDRERERFLQELRERAGRQVYQTTRHILSELANADLEQQIITMFLSQLDSMEQSDWELVSSTHDVDPGCIITTGFPLSEKYQAEVHDHLRQKFGELTSIKFEQDADLICGVEFQRSNQRLSWNVADTVEMLERNFMAALNRSHTSEPVRSSST